VCDADWLELDDGVRVVGARDSGHRAADTGLQSVGGQKPRLDKESS